MPKYEVYGVEQSTWMCVVVAENGSEAEELAKKAVLCHMGGEPVPTEVIEVSGPEDGEMRIIADETREVE